MRLRKTLPADIEQIIASGDVEAVARAVERCEVGAYLRGSAYESRLMHFPASEEITDFLLARGEDINSRDRYERTPIHARVRSRCLDQIPMLIARGGDINARDTSDQTALFGVVERFPVADVEQMIAWGADPLVVADSRVYGKATLVENVVSWHNFLDAPRALAVIRLLLSVGAPVGERVPTALRAMDRMRCTFITHGLPERLSQEEFDEVQDFCLEVGLPTTLEEVGITTDEQIKKIAEAACVPGETIHNLAGDVTPDELYAAIVQADAMGRALKA